MSRDSLFGESILWEGRPKGSAAPAGYRAVAAIAASFALVALAFAIVSATAVHARVGGMLTFAAWCATVALVAWRGPVIWQSGVEYLITDKHVIWRRGPIRRTIDRAAISYAIIRWDPRVQGTGDLVLVRAVPTGALRRTLSLTLSNVVGPDRLWAIVRGLTPSAPLGDGDRPLAQRLDAGERVLWSGTPVASPWTARRAATACVSAMVLLSAVRVVLGSAHGIGRLLRTHALPVATSALLIGAVALTVALMVAIAAKVADAACLRPGRLARHTRYLVTDRRVLIRRGPEELHLDRGRIAYVIAAPVKRLHDVFLVLDGPQARALAASGAFGEDTGDKLRPVLASIEDAEAVATILRAPIEAPPALDHAA
jgi:hypothetical protein